MLLQNKGGQAEILTLITQFRERRAPDATTPLWEARHHAPEQSRRLLHAVEWKLIQMPLPRLQVLGGVQVSVLYQIGWDRSVRQRVVAEYQKGTGGSSSNAITFLRVRRILEDAGLGLSSYYEWRTRSGRYFCFFQRKSEWVRLAERHPNLFEKAVAL